MGIPKNQWLTGWIQSRIMRRFLGALAQSVPVGESIVTGYNRMERTVIGWESRMKLTAIALLLASALLLLGGCSQYWYQEGKSFEECQRDLEAAHAEAFRYSSRGSNRYESGFVREAMEARGYELVKRRDLPPDTYWEDTCVFGVPGAAGTVE